MAVCIKKLEVSNVPDQETKIDRDFMDDTISEAMLEMGDYSFYVPQNSINRPTPLSSKTDKGYIDDIMDTYHNADISHMQRERKLANQFVDDVIAEAETDYKVGVLHKSGISYSQMKK